MTTWKFFLTTAWDFGDGVSVKYFQFAVLPFGLSSAPYLFTKLLKPVVISWRCTERHTYGNFS